MKPTTAGGVTTVSVPRESGGRASIQVSLMDVVSDQRLAGVFTLGLELGPLLARSERISGWLDSASGGHRFSTL